MGRYGKLQCGDILVLSPFAWHSLTTCLPLRIDQNLIEFKRFFLILSKPFWYYRPVSKYLENNFRPKGALTMPRKKALDTAKLIKMVEDETPQAEIMKKMGFKTSTQLKTAYMGALIAEGKVPAIKSSRGAGKAKKVKAIGVGKRGSIVISKDLVESLGIGAGDQFTIRKSKAGIALKKVE